MTIPRISWQTLDWAALERMRERFLHAVPAADSYWSCVADVANYDFTYAQRIGWKWEAVLRELRQRGWTPPPGPVLDWGCGSGMAGRQVLRWMGVAATPKLQLFDRSRFATEYAADAARRAFPGLPVEILSAAQLEDTPSIGLLVASHVLNELDEAAGQALRRIILRAGAVVWVEPGTFADSRALIALRENLKEQFDWVAPCTHQAACGLLAAGNERHWCHHFAKPPVGIMADANWVRFARRAGIDLRSLPYSFLAMERKGARPSSRGRLGRGWSRVLGEPRVYKGFAKILACSEGGVQELELQKRLDPRVFKAFKDREAAALWQWEVREGRVLRLSAAPAQREFARPEEPRPGP